MKKIGLLLALIFTMIICSMAFAETTDLEKAKIAYADASINLEIAQGKYNEARQNLIQELQKPPVIEKQSEEKAK